MNAFPIPAKLYVVTEEKKIDFTPIGLYYKWLQIDKAVHKCAEDNCVG